jgi:hypothetical protein
VYFVMNHAVIPLQRAGGLRRKLRDARRSRRALAAQLRQLAFEPRVPLFQRLQARV